MKELADRVAVITGGASGIGYAAAEAFGAEGMRLVLADVEEAALGKATETLSAQGRSVHPVICDVSDAAAVEALANAAVDTFGGVHLVFNNAGVAVTGSLWDSSLDALKWLIDVNLWGVIHGIRTFVPLMHASGEEGHVISTASFAGLTSSPFLGIYNASKHAVVTLSETLYKELHAMDSKVSASVLCPGFIKTRIMESGRNKPGESTRDPDPEQQSAGGAMLEQVLRAGVDGGIDPATVGAMLVDAVKNDQFYIYPTQDQARDALRQRMDEVVNQRNPSLLNPAAEAAN